MMHLKFPLPVGYFPAFELTPDETLAYKSLVTDLVKDTRREYESYVTTQQRHVDGRKWKLAKSKDRLHFYKRRSEVGAAAIGLTGRTRHGSSSVSSSNGGSLDFSESASSNAFERSRGGSMGSSRSGSTAEGDGLGLLGAATRRLLEPTLLATGVVDGTVDDLVYAFHEPTADDTKGVAAMVGSDAALVDTVVLHTIKCTKTTYLGLKWKLCRTPGGNRDFCFLEYVGVANDAKGQRYGFKVLESVKLRNCPPFADNSIIRTDVSFCYLFRESGTPGIVDVYMHGAFDSSGDAVTAGGVGDARSTMDMLLEVERCMEVAEAKKLVALVTKQAAAPPRPKNSSALCSICRAKPGMLSSHLNCQGCGAVICSKCRVKKVVVKTKRGVTTKLKISCCKICLVNAKETSPFEGEPVNAQPPQLRALQRKPSGTQLSATGSTSGSASLRTPPRTPPRQAPGLESTQELALALPPQYNSQPPKYMDRSRHVAASMTETEFSEYSDSIQYTDSIQSWPSSSVCSTYSDLDDSDSLSGSSQLTISSRHPHPYPHQHQQMPPVAESPRTRLHYQQQQQQQQHQHHPQYAYTSLADGTMVVAPPNAPPSSSNGRYARHLAPPPPMQQHTGAPDLHQHRAGLYNQMVELQMQAERAYNLANQNASTFMPRQ